MCDVFTLYLSGNILCGLWQWTTNIIEFFKSANYAHCTWSVLHHIKRETDFRYLFVGAASLLQIYFRCLINQLHSVNRIFDKIHIMFLCCPYQSWKSKLNSTDTSPGSCSRFRGIWPRTNTQNLMSWNISENWNDDSNHILSVLSCQWNMKIHSLLFLFSVGNSCRLSHSF